MLRGSILLLIAALACKSSRELPISNLENVNRIDVRTRSPVRSWSVRDTGQIAQFVSALKAYPAGWEESSHTMPAGQSVAVLFRDSLVIGVVRIGANFVVARGDSGPQLIRNLSESDVRTLGQTLGVTTYTRLIGRTWQLSRLGSRDIPPPPAGTPEDSIGRDLVPGRRPTLQFTQTQQGVGGRSFCNGYGGPYAIRGDSLRIPEIMSTAVGCDGPDSLETLFFRGLRMTRSFTVDSLQLELIAEDGSRLTFVPAPPSPRDSAL